jgi:glycerophosphoryl diester phosphodiesterase
VLALPASAGKSNPWLTERSFINMAHQGGEAEFPSNTMYAFREALASGADTLELDVNRTKDNQFVVMHDWKVDRTTNGTGYTTDMTVAEIQQLDAAYNFIPGRNAVADQPESAYPFRGIRTGDKPAPTGYGPDDFRVPTLTEVLNKFKNVPINIEIKGQEDEDAEFVKNAELLAELLKGSKRKDLIVVSFNQGAVDRFHELAPNIGIAPGLLGLVGYFLENKPMPNADDVVAVQIPVKYGDLQALTPERVLEAHKQGWAVHMWLSGNEENAEVYNDLLDHCVDGIMPAKPQALEKVLKKRNVIRPNGKGVDPCGAKVKSLGGDEKEIVVELVRKGVVPEAYRGKVEVRNKKGKLLGAAPFKFDDGKAKGTQADVTLNKRGRETVAGKKRVKLTFVTTTRGRRAAHRQKLTFRP